ncbi:MAG: glycosyltransferase family 9 protein [Bacteroidetes bacterium]|nr:glycosyltransferase family 9 protein [Bacteroidota bacterium]
MKEPSSILVIQTAFIGDVILATGILESLHGKFPAAAIDFVIRKGNEGLLKDHPYLRKVHVFDKKNKYRNLFALIREVRSCEYDLVINVQRFATTGILTVLSGAKVTVGFNKNPLSSLFTRRIPHQVGEQHEVVRNHQLIAWLTGGAHSRPRLYPAAAAVEKARSIHKIPYITVSPASVWFTKQFPAEQWISFIRQLAPAIHVYLLGSAEDAALCEQISSAAGGHAVSLAGKLSLLESAAFMQEAIMNYVNDSAPMHLASATNSPVTAVYCSTVPAFGFGPLSDQSFIVETAEKLDCRPCGLHGFRKCPRGDFRCATGITVSQLQVPLVSKPITAA